MEITIIHKIGLESSLFALLSSAITASNGPALASAAVKAPPVAPVDVGNALANSATTSAPSTTANPAPASLAAIEDGERDAAGVLWDPERHASTKTKTGAGLWRMKVGVSRPESESAPVAGNPGTGTNSATPSPIATAPTAPEASVPVNGADEEDEFAAFRAAATAPATPATPAASGPVVRNWSDGDLSKLCNQAALKAGGPEGVKAIIAKFVPEGQVPHSRSIPADQRENFAKEVETTFGITYEG